MKLLRLLLLALLPFSAAAQVPAQGTVSGRIIAEGEGKSLPGVRVLNLHTNNEVKADSNGQFTIAGERDQVLQFYRDGYATSNLRLPSSRMPPVLVQLHLYVPPRTGDPALEGLNPYQVDSYKMASTYQRALALQRLTGYRAVQSPFSYFSRKNRRTWHFQEEFEYFEQQKYVDYVFTDSLLMQIAKIPADSLPRYRRDFTPSYERLRAMRNYAELYYYVKESAEAWRRRERGRSVNRTGR